MLLSLSLSLSLFSSTSTQTDSFPAKFGRDSRKQRLDAPMYGGAINGEQKKRNKQIT